MYKVFINEKVICFTNNLEFEKEFSNVLVLRFYQKELTPFLLELLNNNTKTNAVIVCVEDVEDAFKIFKTNFKLIQAAGGIVINAKNQKLFIYRLGKWDLPKGKIEKNEANEAAAVREVEEECGINNLIISNQLMDTYHVYELNGVMVLKQTFWFSMTSDFKGKLTPQITEDITDVQWLNDEKIQTKVLSNTYSSIAELLFSQLK